VVIEVEAMAIDLVVENMSWSPHRSKLPVEGLSFALKSGERLAVVGATGAGKSSLLKCLHRANRLRSGRILLGGEDIWEMSAANVARMVAVIQQDISPTFPFCVRDIVLMGRIPWRRGATRWSQEDKAKTERALDIMGLAPMAARQFVALSRREKHRVLVAKALAQEPELLIVDEPSSLSEPGDQFEALASVLNPNLIVVAVVRDVDLIAGFATHVLALEHGRIVGYGAPDAVLTPDIRDRCFMEPKSDQPYVSHLYAGGSSAHRPAAR
jgi:iron complex transport system ATP-binding protein